MGGAKLKPHEHLTPRLKVCPLGWSWALWWCQGVHQQIARRAGVLDEQRVVDGRPKPGLEQTAAIIYVDNFVSVSTSRSASIEMTKKVVAEMRRCGLIVHEEEYGVRDLRVLGWEIEGSSGELRPGRDRVWRAR